MRELVKVWMKQTRELGNRIEDVIDDYIRHVGRRPGGERGVTVFIMKVCHCIKTLKLRMEIASEITNIKELHKKMKDRAQTYGLQPLESQESSSRKCLQEDDELRLGSLFIPNDELVGIDSTTKELVSKLVEGPHTRLVISLVGEGGIGKTTLAKNVYNNEVVIGHFDCRAWIGVSQTYNTKKLLREMIRQILPAAEHRARGIDRIEELASLLKEHLETKKYVIVFDDVWRDDFWSRVMRHAVPAGGRNQGRIIVTTRSATTASAFRETPHDPVQELKPWSKELAWKLFCKKAFRHEKLWIAEGFVEAMAKILLVALHSSTIDVTLYKLWIAEGFVEAKSGKTLEEVAEEYLSELIQRNLVQLDMPNEVERWFRVHALMRDVILSRAKETSFFQIADEKETTLTTAEESRRLAIYNTTGSVLESVQGDGLHSISIFDVDNLTKSFVVTLLKRFKRLRVLNFRGASLDELPNEIGDLFHLKYLSLWDTKVKKIPKSIGKLRDLQTLDIRYRLVSELPREINELRKLRHLLGFSFEKNLFHGVRIQGGVGNLRVLQTLSMVKARPGGDGLMILIKDLEKLTEMRQLGISELTKETGWAVCAAIEKMVHLKCLDSRLAKYFRPSSSLGVSSTDRQITRAAGLDS
ncbi:Late blight resistance protein [Morus notabilis]|uniref:Late blight resistance protein n=1 Tax=Morus notabilis TaxID=981085 RepID=W9QUR5_9ROSA|nr:Late blight resistance protein [Morus notabilis]